jgi:hypothetical protein
MNDILHTQDSTLRPKHSHLRVTFVQFFIDRQTASLYIRKMFVPSLIIFFNLTSDFDNPVF